MIGDGLGAGRALPRGTSNNSYRKPAPAAGRDGTLHGTGPSSMNNTILHFSDLVDMNDPHAVMEEVRSIVKGIFPDFDFAILDRAFEDTLLLFAGKMPGYRSCNTRYHDLKHTTDAMLAMARLIDGAVLSSEPLSERDVNLGLIATLFHDTGYIQQHWDITGTGAKYTNVHVERSAEFLKDYFAANGYEEADISDGRSLIKFTGPGKGSPDIVLSSAQMELTGKMLGTADLLGQMADRTYLEKLGFLYEEFLEGNVPGYSDELDLFRNTIDFYNHIRIRFDEQLGGVYRFARLHFKSRHKMDRDLYLDAIESNIDHVRRIVKCHQEVHRNSLRRRSGLAIHHEPERNEFCME